MPAADGTQSALHSSPGHNDRTRCQASLEDLVPANEVAAVLLDHLAHTVDEVALQLVHVLDLRTPHHLAALRTALPRLLARLVPAKVDVCGGENVVHLA